MATIDDISTPALVADAVPFDRNPRHHDRMLVIDIDGIVTDEWPVDLRGW